MCRGSKTRGHDGGPTGRGLRSMSANPLRLTKKSRARTDREGHDACALSSRLCFEDFAEW